MSLEIRALSFRSLMEEFTSLETVSFFEKLLTNEDWESAGLDKFELFRKLKEKAVKEVTVARTMTGIFISS